MNYMNDINVLFALALFGEITKVWKCSEIGVMKKCPRELKFLKKTQKKKLYNFK